MTTNQQEQHRRQGFRVSDGTRSLITRTKRLIRETENQLRDERIWNRTPFGQRPPRAVQGNLPLKATILYSTRALMRGKAHLASVDVLTGKRVPHREGWEEKARSFIEGVLKAAEDYEGMRQKKDTSYVHDTFPAWLRTTLRACIASIELEKKRWEKHEARYMARTAKTVAA